jgi:hypothetical protein
MMSDASRQTWDEVIDALRKAAGDVRAALGGAGEPTAEEQAAAARLKSDLTRLEQSAVNLRAKLSESIDQQRSDRAETFDRERAQQSADQIRVSLEELASVAGRLTTAVAAAAGESVRQSEPELRHAIRSLEDVAGSAAAWVRTVIDPSVEPRSSASRQSGPPLEEM